MMESANRLGAWRVSPSARRALTITMAGLTGVVLINPLVPAVAKALAASTATVAGVVYQDQNNNGEQDSGEPGIADVSVSDGTSVARTDEAGRYTIEIGADRRISDLVFINKPAGFAVPTDQYRTPQFYRQLGQLTDGAQARADFALLPDPQSHSGNFTFANVADPHVNADLANQIAEINSTSQGLAFVQISGDLTNNATDAEYDYYRAATARSTVPVWPAVGNHEYYRGGGTTYPEVIENYRRYLGPEWYSFDHGDRHFIVLENNGAAPFDEQFAWAARDLAENAVGKHLVVLTHQPMNVPFGSSSTYDRYKALFEQYRAELVLVGHEHSNDVDPNWLPGAKHIQTNSGANTIDHSPKGFRFVHMRGAGFDNPFRMYGVQHALTITSPAPDGQVSAKGLREVQVSAYHTSDEVREVRYRIDGSAWKPMRRSGDFTWFDPKIPDAARSIGTHTVDVEASVNRDEVWTKSATFRVTDAEPPTVRPGADWAQFHGNAAHTGVAADELKPDLALAWTHRTPGTIATGSPVVVGGVAYIGIRDENGIDNSGIDAVEMGTGRTLWHFGTDSSVHGTPAVHDGMVYVPSVRGTLYALDTATGQLKWKREAERPDPPLERRSVSYYSPSIADGRVYWAYQTRHGKAATGLLTALDPKTGAAIWETPMTGNRMSDGTPAVADGRIYVGEQLTDRVIAYDAATGARLWTSDTNPDGGSQDAAPAAAGGRVFIGYGNAVIARDATTGTRLWTYQSPDSGFGDSTSAAPAVAGNTLYMGFPDGRVTALDVSTGTVVWSVRLPGRPYHGGVSSSPAVSGNTVYVGANDGHLYGLDRTTGAQRFSYEIGTRVASGPAISGNALLAGAWDGNLYAFTGRA
ncbi:PQQ-binding-like beta-propeller repeat protein [Saccharopolyspora sp. K220]|uniref:outer membrane protein assembly factor BamB family protein n=1 Tax=Saccharopolyspora soli TaxID=2926618 RepID=UPI001F570466|nr:PQQ-binding-like beta-propeller repeat protein [Saccharopolyspora soli]MCI2420256.1 PQQ-binding-like beta-propeller repeat protein [Saccharopolyspora soli]